MVRWAAKNQQNQRNQRNPQSYLRRKPKAVPTEAGSRQRGQRCAWMLSLEPNEFFGDVDVGLRNNSGVQAALLFQPHSLMPLPGVGSASQTCVRSAHRVRFEANSMAPRLELPLDP